MKCHKPGTDQHLFLSLCADGHPLQEYSIPTAPQHPDVVSGYVAVAHDEVLTIHGTFSGTVLHARFDLVGDGSWLGDKVIEGSKDGELKYFAKRSLNYQKLLDVEKPTGPPGREVVLEHQRVVEGTMRVKELFRRDHEAVEVVAKMREDGRKLGLGSIAVVVSLNQKTEDSFEQTYAEDPFSGYWRKRDASDTSNGGISPGHELWVEPTGVAVSPNRQAQHRRHFKSTRFGKKPWAVCVFYYRSHLALQKARAVLRSDEEQLLSVEGAEGYVAVEPTPKKAKGSASSMDKGEEYGAVMRTSRKKTGSEQRRTEGEVSRKSVSHHPYVQSPVTLPAATPPPKRKLFGQPLFTPQPVDKGAPEDDGSESPDTLFVGQNLDAEPEPTDEVETGALFTGDSQREDNFSSRYAFEDAQGYEQEADDFTGLDLENWSGLEGANEYFPTLSAAEEAKFAPLPDFDFGDFPALAEAPLKETDTTSGAGVSPYPHSQSAESKREISGVITHAQIRSLADSHGEINMKTLGRYCDRRSIDQTVGIQMASDIAQKVGPNWVLNERLITHDDATAELEGVNESAVIDGDVNGDHVLPTTDTIETIQDDQNQAISLVTSNAQEDRPILAFAANSSDILQSEMSGVSSNNHFHEESDQPPTTYWQDLSIPLRHDSPSHQHPSPAPVVGMKRKASESIAPSGEGTPAKKSRTDFASIEEYKGYLKSELARKQTLAKAKKVEKERKAAEDAEAKRREEQKAREAEERKRLEEEESMRLEEERKRYEEEEERRRQEQEEAQRKAAEEAERKAAEEAELREIGMLERMNVEEDEALEALMEE